MEKIDLRSVLDQERGIIRRDVIKMIKWLDQEHPAIKRKAQEEKATIHWADETGVRNAINMDVSTLQKEKHL